MSSRRRILVIENSRQVTGALKSIVAMAEDLRDDFEFIFIFPSNSAARSWIQSRTNIRVIELPMLEISKSWRAVFYIPVLFINALRVKRIISRDKIDIVHSNDLYNLIGPVLRSFGVKFKYICHARFLPSGFPSWLYNYWVNRQLSAADKLIVVSDVLKSKLPDVPKVIRIYDRMLLSSSDNIKPNRPGNIILYMANIIPGKGHDHAIQAFAKAHEKFPSWKLRIVGSDMGLEKNRQYLSQLKSMAIRLAVDSFIEWNDFVSDVAIEYKNADIFANFSSSESFSMTCLEAQYYGCCAVATSSGGPAEIISDGHSGILVPVNDVAAMTAALEKLMRDSQLRESMGSNGAKLVRERFGPANTSGMLRNVYMVTFASS
ncbi:MAG: glycosyltransferase family 4 protein [Bacteroidota bacterium]